MAFQTRSQRYAGEIFELVRATRSEKYKTMVQKLPFLIRTAGLAQALAFTESGTDADHLLLNDLARVLGFSTREELLRRSRNDSLLKYARLTHEVMDALLWFKRFAQGTSSPPMAVSPGGSL